MTFNSIYIPSKPESRQLLVGDIHGCAKTFDLLLEKMDLKLEDQLIILGDMINKGPDSQGVLDRILALQELGHQVYILRGNNESLLLKVLKKGEFRIERLAVRFGILGLFKSSQWKLKGRYKRLLKNTYYFIESDGFIAVHAGFDFTLEDPFTDKFSMMWIRDFISNHEKQNGKPIIHGHRVRPMKRIKNAIKNEELQIPLDNGCVLGRSDKRYGRLLCYDFTNKILYKKKYAEN